MFVLSPTDRWIILAGSFGLLGVVVLVTLCVVCPFCWIYKKVHKSHSLKKRVNFKGRRLAEGNHQVGCFGSISYFLNNEPPPPYEPRDETELRYLSDLKHFNRKLTPTSSTSSTSESVTGIPLPFIDDVELELPDPNAPSEGDQGYCNIGVVFKPPNEENGETMGQLTLILKEAINLPFRQYGGRCDPYLEVQLYKTKGRQKSLNAGSVPICQFHTSISRRTQNPVFDGAYVIPWDPANLQKCLIKLIAWDNDKLANDSVIGECILTLKDLPLEEDKEYLQTLTFRQSKQNNGQLLLGLCYLPTAERMTVAVLKANNIKQSDGSPCTAPYVQAMAIYGGKVLEKRKTSNRPGSAFPIFNEMLMFDVPYNKLDHIMLLVVARNSMDSRLAGTTKLSSEKDPYMGKVVIGSCCRKNGSDHWNAMKNSPRRQVIQWHILR